MVSTKSQTLDGVSFHNKSIAVNVRAKLDDSTNFEWFIRNTENFQSDDGRQAQEIVFESPVHRAGVVLDENVIAEAFTSMEEDVDVVTADEFVHVFVYDAGI